LPSPESSGDFSHLYGTQGFVYFNPTDQEVDVEPIILTGDEADLHNAIRALAPLLSDADRAKYRDIIYPKLKSSLAQKYKEWKARNAR
jgi:hypothetical protein